MDAYSIAVEIVSRLDQDGLVTDTDEAVIIVQSVLQEFEDEHD